MREEKLAALDKALSGKPNVTYDGDTSVTVTGGMTGVLDAVQIAINLMKDSDVDTLQYKGKTYTTNEILDLGDELLSEVQSSGNYNIDFSVTYEKDGVSTTVDYSVNATK